MGERPAAEFQPGLATASKILVVGGSAGSLGPLTRLVEGLQSGTGAAALVVLHRASHGHSVLPSILNRHSVFRAAEPSDGDPLLPDYVYLAPADRHLEVAAGRVHVVRGPKVNGQRPAVDVLFESAARVFGPAVVAVVLSGNLDDGSHGLYQVRRAGGLCMVQDPADADFPDMPGAALARAQPQVVATSGLPGAVAAALNSLPDAAPEVVRSPAVISKSKPMANEPLGAGDEPGEPIGVTCPECGGTLWLSDEPGAPMVSCRIGHRYSPATFHHLQSERLERVLWAALRSLEEQVAVATFMADMYERRNDSEAADRQRQRRDSASRQTEELRAFLLQRDGD
ncbi:MAG TPA: chemotaxis protein CheB [Candidatus Dormibacteraeota bacterium]